VPNAIRSQSIGTAAYTPTPRPMPWQIACSESARRPWHTQQRGLRCQAVEFRGQQQTLSPTALKTMYVTHSRLLPAMASPVAARNAHEELGKLFREHEDAKRRFEELNVRGLSGS